MDNIDSVYLWLSIIVYDFKFKYTPGALLCTVTSLSTDGFKVHEVHEVHEVQGAARGVVSHATLFILPKIVWERD